MRNDRKLNLEKSVNVFWGTFGAVKNSIESFGRIEVIHSAVRHRLLKRLDDALHAVGNLKDGGVSWV